MRPSQPVPVLLLALLLVLAAHAFGTGLDFLAAIQEPGELDYGEGIVWQQAALIPGPRMYAAGQGLPFIAFHYPPVFYLLTHAVGAFMPDLLAAGRLVSAISAVAIAMLVTSLVLAAAPLQDGTRRADRLCCALAAGLLAFCVHALRIWAMFMRVDTLAVALGLAGVLVAARANGRLRGTACGLLLCIAAVYCKQTELPAGLAVFIVATLRNPRVGLSAGCIALVAGLVPLAALQSVTHGGFLQNIIGYNINSFNLSAGVGNLYLEALSLPLAALIVLAAFRLFPAGIRLNTMAVAGARLASRTAAARAMLMLHFMLSTVMLLTIFKSGGSINYFIDWLCVGCVLLGVFLCGLNPASRATHFTLAALCGYALLTPLQILPIWSSNTDEAQQAALVRRIAQASKPVGSENMVLLMRAGKPVIYEPAIVTELAALGRWDERPLVDMIASGGFAFMLTSDDASGPPSRRSPAVDAAMRHAYPKLEQVGARLWLRSPQE